MEKPMLGLFRKPHGGTDYIELIDLQVLLTIPATTFPFAWEHSTFISREITYKLVEKYSSKCHNQIIGQRQMMVNKHPGET